MATADLLTMAPKTGDRQKALDSALAQIERQFGKGSIMTLGEGAVIPGSRRPPPAQSAWILPSALAAYPRVGSLRSTARSRPVKQL